MAESLNLQGVNSKLRVAISLLRKEANHSKMLNPLPEESYLIATEGRRNSQISPMFSILRVLCQIVDVVFDLHCNFRGQIFLDGEFGCSLEDMFYLILGFLLPRLQRSC